MQKSFASPVLTFSDRSTQRTQLVLGQVAVGTGLEHSELHTADGDTAQSADLKAYCGAHAAYLAVSALLDDEAEHRSLRGFGQHLHRAGERLYAVVKLHAGHQPGKLILVYHSVNGNAVCLGNVLRRVHDVVR